ncbi:unnamed protein product [Heligmosomoides polygyrus]|uniref:Peptidase_S9_N domain-containing protein n=1 Tax=Heligmosomoides polygyrus TaxID=6339 RepID=A0A183G768_HELPZ|nr:unnamed protein product [Heligmosomoides polygyrus]
MTAHQVFPLDDVLCKTEYSHERGGLESIASSMGSSRYVYFVHRKTVIPCTTRQVLTVYDLWTGSSSEYAVQMKENEQLREFYELDSDEGVVIVENDDDLVVLHIRLYHHSKEIVEMDRIQIIEKCDQREGMKEYRCMRSEKGFTMLACSRMGIRVVELQFNKKFVDVAHTDIVYDGEYYFLYTDPWREGDIIYCFESEAVSESEDDRRFDGNLFAIDLSRKEIHSYPPHFPFAPSLSSPSGKGVVHVVGVFHRPGHLWVVTQNSSQNATLSVWRLDSDGWHSITTVDNDEYEVTMDVCADGSAMVVLEDEVNGHPIMRNIRYKCVS